MMTGETPREVADRIFGGSSWPWISEALSHLDFDPTTPEGESIVATVIAASHGDREQLLRYIDAVCLDHFQVELHQEWLHAEEPFAREASTAWFARVIREMAPVAIHQGLHAMIDHSTLMIDRRSIVRAETIVLWPQSCDQVLIRLHGMASGNEISESVMGDKNLLERLSAMFAALPSATAYSKMTYKPSERRLLWHNK